MSSDTRCSQENYFQQTLIMQLIELFIDLEQRYQTRYELFGVFYEPATRWYTNESQQRRMRSYVPT